MAQPAELTVHVVWELVARELARLNGNLHQLQVPVEPAAPPRPTPADPEPHEL